MKYLKQRRLSAQPHTASSDDPMENMANMFDLGMVFIVGFLLALMTTYSVMDLVSTTSEMTIVKQTADGRMEIITKKGENIKVEKLTDRKISGVEGVKLGTAYKLKNGKCVYVAE